MRGAVGAADGADGAGETGEEVAIRAMRAMRAGLMEGSAIVVLGGGWVEGIWEIGHKFSNFVYIAKFRRDNAGRLSHEW